MSIELVIHLDLGPDRDLRELERASTNLRSELRRLDGVELVQPAPLVKGTGWIKGS